MEWLKHNDFLATWLQGVGTIVAFAAILVAIYHFRREGFAPAIRLLRDNREHDRGQLGIWQYIQVNVENLGRATGRVDRAYLVTLRGWWQLNRRKERWDADETKVPVITRANDLSGTQPAFPLDMPGGFKESIAMLCDKAQLNEKRAAVIVVAGGRRKTKRLRGIEALRLGGFPQQLPSAGAETTAVTVAEQPAATDDSPAVGASPDPPPSESSPDEAASPGR